MPIYVNKKTCQHVDKSQKNAYNITVVKYFTERSSDVMATKSITKNINIKDRTSARNLASALENSKNKGHKTVDMSKASRDVKGEEILKIFGAKI